MQKLESKKEKIKFSRVDSDTLENLIKKDEEVISKLTDEEKEKLKPMIETAVENEKYTVQLEALDSNSMPFMLAQPEFMRRMKEMQQTGGGAMGNLPDMYSLIVNTNHELVSKILNTRTEKKRNSLIKQSIDLAKLSQNNLTGKDLTEFINRSIDLIK
jgi:molecular chaperone HtpG